MKRLFAAAAFGAAMFAFAPATFAQEMEGDYYVVDAQGGTKLIVSKANPQGVPLGMATGGVRPTDCPAGSFYDMDGTIMGCDGDMAYDTATPDTPATGMELPQGAMVLKRRQ